MALGCGLATLQYFLVSVWYFSHSRKANFRGRMPIYGGRIIYSILHVADPLGSGVFIHSLIPHFYHRVSHRAEPY